MELRVDSRVRVPLEGLGDEVRDGLRAAFEHHNPKREALKRMGIRSWHSEPAIIRTWSEVRGEFSAPRGGMARVRKVLEAAGLEWSEVDLRCEGDRSLGEVPACPVEPRAHQLDALAAFLPREQGIVRAPTGSGKTTFGFMAASAVRLPTLVIVDQGNLLKQWSERAEAELGLSPSEVGLIQGQKQRVRAFTVGMAQTLAKCARDFSRTFGLVVFDEVQTAAAPTFLGAADPFEARYRLGISADERRKDGKEFLIHDVFGEVVHEVDKAELEDAGVVLDVELRAVPTEFRADWYGMPDAGADEETEIDFDRLLKEMALDQHRNALAVELAMGEVYAGQQVLLMAHQRDHCRELSSQLVAHRARAGFLIGGPDYRREFDRSVEALKGRALDVGVGTLKAIGKGIDLPAVGRAVVVTPIFANKQFSGQVRGRICRAPKGKADAVQYVLWDQHCSFGERHLRNMVAWNKTVRVLDGGRWVEGKEYVRRRYGTRAA